MTLGKIDKESRGLLKWLNRVERDIEDLDLDLQIRKITVEAPA
jgi:hypothetical protein